MVGEIRDSETAEIALTAAQTGHLLFSTLHTNDSASTISRLIDLQVPPFFIAASVNAILAQRLVRKLCSCRTASEDVTELQSGLLSLGYESTPVVAYVPKGCDRCDNTGYSGRIGVYELLLLDDRIRQAIRNNVRDDALRDFVTSNGMRLMIDDAVNKVMEGITTLDEVLRVVPHVTRVNSTCTHCHSDLNPKFSFCPNCGTACQPASTIPGVPMSQNNRSADRYSLYDNLQICYEGFTNEIPVRVPDLSSLGMFIDTSLTFPEGAVLRISFVLPRTNVQIRARGEVRYCLSGVGLGVEFINLESEYAESIELELSARKSPHEARRAANSEAVS